MNAIGKGGANNYGSVQGESEPLKAVAMVEVIAPSNLPEGYKFTGEYEGVKFPVIVPAGGCTEGQQLIVPFNPDTDADAASAGTASPGAWKDGLFDCFKFGILHPSFLCACCCQLILQAQIMTRLKLDIMANPNGNWEKTFVWMVRLLVVYLVYVCLDGALYNPPEKEEFQPLTTWGYYDNFDFDTAIQAMNSPLCQFVSFLVSIYFIFVVMKTRKAIRQRHRISEERCIGCEDLVCSLCCQCCAISQMARQTADYEEVEGRFLSPDGLPVDPAITLEV